MGIIDRLFGSRSRQPMQTIAPHRDIAVGADNSSKEVTITFNDKNITFSLFFVFLVKEVSSFPTGLVV